MADTRFPDRLWYDSHPLGALLAPAGWIYGGAMIIRRLAYSAGVIPVRRVDVPVVVVGNLTVGGTGKTPLVIWLVRFLCGLGYRPGVLSRGYGGRGATYPQQVRPDSNPLQVGDEPVIIARRTGVPVAVDPVRHRAALELTLQTDCDVLVCDDGLQHYGLHRDIEIAVIDGRRQFGNGRCLPAGPLREPRNRLQSVDMIVSNGAELRHYHTMEYTPVALAPVREAVPARPVEHLAGQRVHALAGIGNPERFFAMLRRRRIEVIPHAFPDHHRYTAHDLAYEDGLAVVMTEKDAVKCERFAPDNCWFIPVEARMSSAFEHRFTVLMKEITHG